MSRFAYQPLQSDVIFLEKNQGTSEKRNLKKIFFFYRLHDFSPTIIIKKILERLLGRSAHHLNLERLIGISAHLIQGGQIGLCYK